VAVFAVDRESGALNFTGQWAAVGNPSMVLFVDLDVK
jgi:6-phosphogluconolactonase (cycloisomerase 2 family)